MAKASSGQGTASNPGGSTGAVGSKNPQNQGSAGPSTAPAPNQQHGSGKVYVMPTVVMCEQCYQAMNLWSRMQAEVTFVHPEFQQCPNNGKRFTFQIPSVVVQ